MTSTLQNPYILVTGVVQKGKFLTITRWNRKVSDVVDVAISAIPID